MSTFEIQSALAQRLNSLAGIPDIYWGATKKTPTKGTNWVRPTLVPFDSEMLDFAGEQNNTGIYQVAIFTDLGEGEGPLLSIADDIADHFKAQQILTEGTTEVSILAVSITQPLIVDAWLQCNVEINYKNIC
jgi:hypothetical protein